MSTFTINLSDADDRALAAVNAAANAALPVGETPLNADQYLRQTIRGWLQSYKKEIGRINSGLILSRIPRAKWAGFFDSVDPAVVAFRELLLNQATVGRFGDNVDAGLAACVAAGVLTKNQADALVAP
jgi:hypothetical protein